VAYLDGLRAVAALMVFAGHAAAGGLLPLAPLGSIGFSLVSHGPYGVTIFFVLSAYTLCMSVAPRFDGEPVSWRAYFIRRFFRIAPLYYVVMLYAAYHGPDRPDYPLTMLLHLSFANMFVPQYANDILSVEWTVAVEWGFYVMFPAFVVLARSRVGLAAIIAAPVIFLAARHRVFEALPIHGEDRLFSPLFHLYAFAGGVAVYVLVRRDYLRSIAGRYLAWYLNLPCAAMIAFMLWRGTSAYSGPFVAFITGVVIVNAQSGGLARSILSWRPLAFIGKISFSIYLLQVFFLSWGQVLGWRPELELLAALAATLAAATVTYFCIERPGMIAGRLLAQRAATRTLELQPASTTPA
jgi:peptidoglycan/LPS O-acetylase OafA/YrhL